MRSFRRAARQSRQRVFPAIHCCDRSRYNRVERGPGRCADAAAGRVLPVVRSSRQSRKRRRSLRSRISSIWRRLSGAAVCIRMSGASPRCCIGCGTILRSARSLPAPSNIAIWLRPRLPASTILRRWCAVFARWDISGCGMRVGMDFRRRISSSVDPLLDGVREKLQSPVKLPIILPVI